MSGDEFGSKFSYAAIWGRGAEGSRMQNLPLFKPIDRKSKVVYHIKKSTPSPKLIIVRYMAGVKVHPPPPNFWNMFFPEEDILEKILSHVTRNQNWPNLQNGGHFD